MNNDKRLRTPSEVKLFFAFARKMNDASESEKGQEILSSHYKAKKAILVLHAK